MPTTPTFVKIGHLSNGAFVKDSLRAQDVYTTGGETVEQAIINAAAVAVGALNYHGVFNAATGKDGAGEDIPAASADNKGFYWIASVAGSFTPPGADTAINFDIGDWLVSNGAGYNDIDNTTVDQAARTAAQNAQTAAQNAQTAAETAQTEAELLDAAFCEDEDDLAGKNLRNGGIVCMSVSNDTIDITD